MLDAAQTDIIHMTTPDDTPEPKALPPEVAEAVRKYWEAKAACNEIEAKEDQMNAAVARFFVDIACPARRQVKITYERMLALMEGRQPNKNIVGDDLPPSPQNSPLEPNPPKTLE